MINEHKITVASLEERRPFGRPRRRWEDTIKADNKKYGVRVCIGFIWFTIGIMAGTSEHGNKLIPQKWGIFLSS
jgi:hypothetical protein